MIRDGDTEVVRRREEFWSILHVVELQNKARRRTVGKEERKCIMKMRRKFVMTNLKLESESFLC